MSDSHGNKDAVLKAAARESPDLILHLGDHDRDCSVIELEYPEIPLRSVRGNCDRSSYGLDTDEFTLGGKRFFMTHGNLYRVKTGLSSIIDYACTRSADILLFGHTHYKYQSESEQMTIINPGSIGMGEKTYAVLELKNGAVISEFFRVSAIR